VTKMNRAVVAASAAIGLCWSAIVFAEPPPAPATQPASQAAAQDLGSEIKTLRARLDQLEAQQKESDRKLLESQQKQEQQAAIDAVNKSTTRHDNLLDVGGFTSGYTNNRFTVQSDDGRFVLRPWYHLQIRDVTLLRQDFKKNNRDDLENGFEIRRMKIGLDGNMFTPDFTYFFNWATSRANGTANVTDSTGKKIGTVSNSLGGVPILEEAWVKYKFPNTSLYIKGGQIKDPLLHDQIVSSRYQQSAERSLTADVFANGDAFTEGVTLIYDPKTFIRTEVGFTHGIRSANTNFFDYPTNGFDYGAAGRAELKLFGRWQDYGQIGAVDVKEPLLVLGVGADYSERGHSGQTVGAVDAHFALPAGLNFYGAVVDRYTNHNFGIEGQSATGASISAPPANVLDHATNEYSFLAEAGYLIHRHWEPFGRYEYMHLAGTATGSRNYFHVITAGVNYYIVGHRAKLTGEVIYLPNGIPIDDGASDTFASPNGKGEISAGLQFQLLL
jgi:hypothetical protein